MSCEDVKCRCSGMVIIAPLTFISIPLYVAVIWTLIKYRNSVLSSSFFTLNISIGIADLANLIINDILFKLPQYCAIIVLGNDFALAHSEIVGKIGAFLFWYLNHAQLCGVVVITLNRFTALAMPIAHSKIWTGRKLRLSVIGMWVIPLAFSLPIFATSSYFRAMYDNNTLVHYLYSYRKGMDEVIVYGFSAVYVGIVLNGVLLTLYCVQFFKYWKHSRQTRNNFSTSSSVSTGTNLKDRTEFKLAICGLIFFSFMSCYGVLDVLMVFEALGYFRCHLCIHMFNIVGDIFCWINAYLLLIFSKSVRECFMKTFGIDKCCSRTKVSQLRVQLVGSKSNGTNS